MCSSDLPDPVTHFNGYNTALVLGAAAPGYSSGQALDILDRLSKEILEPKGYGIDWSGISYQEHKSGSQSVFVFAFGLLMPGIDNFAHAGGFAGGYLTSALFNPLTREKGDHMLIAVVCLLLTFAAVAVSLVQHWRFLGL